MAIKDAAVTAVVSVIDDLFTTDEERANAKLKLLELAHRGDIAQLGVNQEEAKSSSLFVSGWRPAVGWTCLMALVLNFVLFPVLESAVIYYTAFTGEHVDLSALPVLEWETLGPILMGMLGLGGLRSWEKTKGVARK